MFGSSGGKSNTSSSSTTNQTQTSTPTNPAWVTGGLGGIGQTLSDLNGIDPYSLVPGANAQQTGAANMGANLGIISNGDLAGSNSLYTGVGQANAPMIGAGGGAAQIAPNISTFMNPNIQSVVNPSLAAFDFSAGQTQAQQDLSQAGTDSAFGGSGGALAKAATASQLALGRGQLAGSLYGGAYDSGLSAATDQANLQEQANQRHLQAQEANQQAVLAQRQIANQAAAGIANNGLNADANTRGNMASLSDIGNNLYQISANQAQAPITLASALSGIWGQLPLNLLHGETDTLNGTSTGKGSTTSLSGGFSFG